MSLETIINSCLLPKLNKNIDESEHHSEYGIREKRLETDIDLILRKHSEINLEDKIQQATEALASILILYKELLSQGPWHSEKFVDYAKKLRVQCEVLLKVRPQELLSNVHRYDNQAIFDVCMQKLHLKLTSSNLKKYPSLIEVYHSIVEDIQNYKNVLVDAKILPISLYLIDDYNPIYKKKGLVCCNNVLKNLIPGSFSEGNYCEVVYRSLKKILLERDLEITKHLVDCFMQLIKALPERSEFKLKISEELYAEVLEQIHVESNLHRKAVLLVFVQHLVGIIGVNAVKRKTFHVVICDNLDLSCNEGVGEILIDSVINCLEEWVKHCWCTWKLRTGQKLLSKLFKVLYVTNESTTDKVCRIIATLILLCSKDDIIKIAQNLREPNIADEKFLRKIELVNKYIIFHYFGFYLKYLSYHITLYTVDITFN